MRAAIGLDIGKLDTVTVVPVAEDPGAVLLVLSGETGKATIELHRSDLWTIATSCRNAARLCEMHQLLAKVPA